MACLPRVGSVPAAYAVVAGGCDWLLPPAVGRSKNDVIVLRPLRQFRCVPYVPYVACVALDGNAALSTVTGGWRVSVRTQRESGMTGTKRTFHHSPGSCETHA